jgi:hypothetical protein
MGSVVALMGSVQDDLNVSPSYFGYPGIGGCSPSSSAAAASAGSSPSAASARSCPTPEGTGHGQAFAPDM